MYEIRQYYIEPARNNELRYHIYNYYNTFDEAYIEYINLYKWYDKVDSKVNVFSISFPENKLESFVRFLDKKNKTLITIKERR